MPVVVAKRCSEPDGTYCGNKLDEIMDKDADVHVVARHWNQCKK